MQVNFDVSHDEMATLKRFLPMIQNVKHLVPKELLSLLLKIEHELGKH